MLKFDWNLLFTAINVLILLVALRFVLFKPVRKILEARQAEADAGIDEAKKKLQEAEEAKAEAESVKAEIEASKKDIMKECRAKAEEEGRQIVEQAKAEADTIREEASKDAEHYKAQAVKDAEKEITGLITSATEKVMAEKKGAQSDSDLYDRFINSTEA